MTSGKKIAFPRKAAAGLAALLCACLAAPIIALAVPVAPDYSWYRGHEGATSYTLTSPGQMMALSQIVQGTADADGDGAPDWSAQDFAGAELSYSSLFPASFGGNEVVPIGSAAHPFQGRFDGAGAVFDNFTITSTADGQLHENVGLFGYVGPQGSLTGVAVGASASVSIERAAESREVVQNVGMVAGYCAGTMSDCSNAGSLRVYSEAVQQSADTFLMICNVGGVCGQCVFDMTGCSNSGTVYVNENSAPVTALSKAQLVSGVGGVVGFSGDATRQGTAQEHVYGDPGKHGTLRACSNTGKVTVETDNQAGLDRFGMVASAESIYVGGVAGYSQGSIFDCVNGAQSASFIGQDVKEIGYVRAVNADMIGGICGSVRGVYSSNVVSSDGDDGADGADPLVISGCTNYGDVYGRVGAGGIVGKCGTYTTTVQCVNANKLDAFGNTVTTYVIATRWNKPGPGGIVGSCSGTVAYCANLATVASAEWKDEDARTLSVKEGYYAAGIVGKLNYFTADDAETGASVRTTPLPEVYGCLSAGYVLSGDDMRQRGIVGDNNGYVHNCVLVSGLVYNDKIVYGDDPEADTEAAGISAANALYTASELRGDKASEAIALLNANCEAIAWSDYWVPARNATSSGVNAGYPVLARQSEWGSSRTDLSAATVTLVHDAAYTGSPSAPQVDVVLSGKRLSAGVDYRVVADVAAVEVSSGNPYRASVEGLGAYAGTAAKQVPYDVVKGDLSSCTVTADSVTFDYEPHVPSSDQVSVTCANGTPVDSAEYSYAVVDDAGAVLEAPVDAGQYRLVVTAKGDSPHFSGQAEGVFRIAPASLMRDVQYSSISFLGADYPFKNSTEAGESSNPSTTLPYIGSPVMPAVGSITYKGHELVENVDYKVVYGNSRTDDSYTGSLPDGNAGQAGGSSVGCVTVRYITGQKCNFSSYANMYFNIVDDGSKADLSRANIVAPEQVYDGRPLRPVKLYAGKAELVEGVDYEISYTDNVEVGTAHFTAKGIGMFAGELSGEFDIVSASLVDVLYSFGPGLTCAVTGVEYHGNRDTFELVVPETVEHEGVLYTVTSVAAGAFGGSGTSQFTGSLANESKLKLSSVSLPATVTSLGDYAFGYAGNQYPEIHVPLSEVTFAVGSQLEHIGDYAFASCRELVSLSLPASVDKLGECAFWRCESLSRITFETTDPAMPGTVAAGATRGAFRSLAGVEVVGYSQASAVRAIAEENAGASDGVNGGRMFTFSELAGALSDASIALVPDVTYTGQAIEPALSVAVDGVALTRGVDYHVEYSDNVNVGVAAAVVRGIGRYAGYGTATFAIAPRTLGDRTEISPIPTQAASPAGVQLALTVIDGNVQLVQGRDFTVSFADEQGNPVAAPAEPGSYFAVVNGQGNYTGQAMRRFNVVEGSAPAAIDISAAQVYLADAAPLYYDGTPKEPAVTVVLDGAAVPLESCRVEYFDNTQAGTARVEVTGLGDYTGTARGTFQILSAVQPPTPSAPAASASQQMYRLYNPNSGEHFYTADANERDMLRSVGWSYEGVGWKAPTSGANVYRLYNPHAGEHHYTQSASERDMLVGAGWNYEGVGWKSAGSNGVPLYRQYNPNQFACNHNYTTSKAENDWLVSLGWRAEGVGWYGVS